jgi:hypothetical protein
MENSNHYDLCDMDDTEHLFDEVKKKAYHIIIMCMNFSLLLLVCFHVKRVPCHCGTAHAQIIDEGKVSRYGG